MAPAAWLSRVDLDGLLVVPGDGRLRALGQDRFFVSHVNAGADDRKVLVDAIEVVEARGPQLGKERGLRLAAAELHGRLRADVADGLQVLRVQPHRFARPRGDRFHRFGHARGAVALLVDLHVDHLPHGIESRAVEAYLVAGLDQRAAVERVVAGDGVLHLQAQQFALGADADRRPGVAAVAEMFVRRPGRDDARRHPGSGGRVGQRNAGLPCPEDRGDTVGLGGMPGSACGGKAQHDDRPRRGGVAVTPGVWLMETGAAGPRQEQTNQRAQHDDRQPVQASRSDPWSLLRLLHGCGFFSAGATVRAVGASRTGLDCQAVRGGYATQAGEPK